jgi:hypothetical protein
MDMTPVELNGWQKILADGTIINGCDRDVDTKQASWRNSPLDNINSVNICQMDAQTGGLIQCHITSPYGPFWQSDESIAPVRLDKTVQGTRIKRRIEKRITHFDQFIYISSTDTFLDIYIEPQSHLAYLENNYTCIPVTQEHIGMWIIAELDIEQGLVQWYFSKEMI